MMVSDEIMRAVVASPLLCSGNKLSGISKREAMFWILANASQSQMQARAVSGAGAVIVILNEGEIILPHGVGVRDWGWSIKAMRCFIALLERHGILNRVSVSQHSNVSTVFKVNPHELLVAKTDTSRRDRSEKQQDVSRRASISPSMRLDVFAQSRGKCSYCGVGLTVEKNKPNSFHVDHIKPVSSGGANDRPNLVASCLRCNLKKNAADLSLEGDAA